jgi:hypothetical protein
MRRKVLLRGMGRFCMVVLVFSFLVSIVNCAKPDGTKGKAGNTLETAVLKKGWYKKDEGDWRWMGKDAVAVVTSGSEGKLLVSGYLPPEILEKAYGGALSATIMVNNKEMAVKKFAKDNIKDGNWYISGDVPKNAELTVEIELDKSYVPAKTNMGPDTRELGVIVNRLEAK